MVIASRLARRLSRNLLVVIDRFGGLRLQATIALQPEFTEGRCQPAERSVRHDAVRRMLSVRRAAAESLSGPRRVRVRLRMNVHFPRYSVRRSLERSGDVRLFTNLIS